MFASRVRAKAQPTFQPLGGDVQVPHPEDDMVQARHAGSLRTAATTFVATATALAATIGPHTWLHASDRILGCGLERVGLGSNLTRSDMERLGFYVCVADLEDELIRALGAASVELVIDAQGDLGSFRTLQMQPAWRGRAHEEQLRRFMGSGGRRKMRYARLLVDALDLDRVPRPLDRVLAHV